MTWHRPATRWRFCVNILYFSDFSLLSSVYSTPISSDMTKLILPMSALLAQVFQPRIHLTLDTSVPYMCCMFTAVPSVLLPTQIFKTPVSSREASWKESPDDSGRSKGIKMTWKTSGECQALRDPSPSWCIPYLPEMPKGRPPTSARLLWQRARLRLTSQERNDPSWP